MDEMLWALKWFKDHFTDSQPMQGKLFDQAAQMLGANLRDAHPLPHDLERRIANEMVITHRSEASELLKEAV